MLLQMGFFVGFWRVVGFLCGFGNSVRLSRIRAPAEELGGGCAAQAREVSSLSTASESPFLVL